MKRLYVTLSVGFLALSGALAQTNVENRSVKRITFDREQVNVEYTDGTKDLSVDVVTVKRQGAATGVVAAKTVQPLSARQWYTTDGRAMKSTPRQKGVYVVREKNVVKKTIKK